jgi:hypothetical protein
MARPRRARWHVKPHAAGPRRAGSASPGAALPSRPSLCCWPAAPAGSGAPAYRRRSTPVTGRLLTASADAGYRLRQVIVEDAEHAARGAARQPRRPYGPAASRHRSRRYEEEAQSLGWIRSVTVERRLPDALYVRITEDYPAAIWQQSGTFR